MYLIFIPLFTPPNLDSLPLLNPAICPSREFAAAFVSSFKKGSDPLAFYLQFFCDYYRKQIRKSPEKRIFFGS
ncbi:hypothetical protein EBR96_04775 [bacterium]|nr:hypothetical protein [bacterium]